MYTAASSQYKFKRDDIPCHTGQGLFNNEVMEAKIYKCLGHLFYPDADILIWIDANIKSNLSPDELVKKYLGFSELCVNRHFHRDCIYDEGNVLLNDPRFDKWTNLKPNLKSQLEHYRDFHPAHWGLWECNFFIRRTYSTVNKIFEQWWAEICRWQQRDQISFPYVLRQHKSNINFKELNFGNIRECSDFRYEFHY